MENNNKVIDKITLQTINEYPIFYSLEKAYEVETYGREKLLELMKLMDVLNLKQNTDEL
jgi:hypothetical protein